MFSSLEASAVTSNIVSEMNVEGATIFKQPFNTFSAPKPLVRRIMNC